MNKYYKKIAVKILGSEEVKKWLSDEERTPNITDKISEAPKEEFINDISNFIINDLAKEFEQSKKREYLYNKAGFFILDLLEDEIKGSLALNFDWHINFIKEIIKADLEGVINE